MKKIFFIGFILLFFACEYTSENLEVDTRGSGLVNIEAFKNGSLVKVGSKFNYKFSFDTEIVQPDSYEFYYVDLETNKKLVFDAKSKELLDKEYAYNLVDLDYVVYSKSEILELNKKRGKDEAVFSSCVELSYSDVIPKLDNGFYKLVLSVYKLGNLVSSADFKFFISDKEMAVSSVSSYPVIIYPGGEALLFSEFKADLDDDVYVVWGLDEKVIYKCRFSEIPEYVRWRAPKEESIVTLSVGFYPQNPPKGEIFDFEPPVIQKSNLFISSNQKSEIGELGSLDNYYSLFHFRGETKDYKRPDVLNKVFGNVLLNTNRDFFGYSFFEKSSIELDYGIIPLNEDRELMPFSLNGVVGFDNNSSGSIVTIKESGENVFKLVQKRNGVFIASLKIEDSEVVSVSSIGAGENFLFKPLTLSVYPEPDSNKISFIWYKDGQMLNRDEFSFKHFKLLKSLKTVIGGDDSFSGIIDELGVYYLDDKGRSSLDSTQFNKSIKDASSNSILFADGFDSFYLDDYKVSRKNYKHSVSSLDVRNVKIETKEIVLDDTYNKVELALNSFEEISGNFKFDISGFKDGNTSRVVVDLKNNLFVFNGERSNISFSSGVISFEILRKGDLYFFVVGRDKFLLGFEPYKLVATFEDIEGVGFSLSSFVVSKNKNLKSEKLLADAYFHIKDFELKK